jgi:SAM-dependent methyltransferase
VKSTDCQSWEPDGYQRHAGFVPELGQEILRWLAPQPGERILDVGCGDGALTARLVEAGARVVGLDASSAMVDRAKARGVDAHVGNGTAIASCSPVGQHTFDAVFSNAALHWMRPPEAVVSGVLAVLREGGRFVAEFGGHGNVAAIRVALAAALNHHHVDAEALDPWYYPTAEEYGALLESHGLRVHRAELFARPTPLPTGIEGWLHTFAQPFLGAVPSEERDAVIADVQRRLRSILCDASGNWTADYVRLRIAAFN